MAAPYVGEIRMFAGNFAPAGWMFCAGQPLPISEYQTLFTLIGTTYGGDGQNTFQLPNLQGRAPMHIGTGPGLPPVTIGEIGGVENVTLTLQQIPSHPHTMTADAGTTTKSPANALPGLAGSSFGGVQTYQPSGGATTQLSPKMLQMTGGNQAHSNLQPFLCVSFIISLYGIYPSQN
ncbi:MAG TPA: tail fiber protein [Xanthobacteraceae bacterium]|nr:tail fiber protein [Xanthobacteraceae bacterium]